MINRPITKTNMAISMDIELSKQLREVAKQEDRSISYIIQKCVQEYLPIIRSEYVKNESYCLEKMVSRLAAAVSTPDMRRCGVMPSNIEFNEKGEVIIGLKQLQDENGKPIPIKAGDISKPIPVVPVYEDDGLTSEEVHEELMKISKTPVKSLHDKQASIQGQGLEV